MSKHKKKYTNAEENTFDSLAFFRDIKEQIAKELEGKSFAEQQRLIKKILSGEVKLIPSSHSIVAEPKPKYGKK